jgi:hypothetical protein
MLPSFGLVPKEVKGNNKNYIIMKRSSCSLLRSRLPGGKRSFLLSRSLFASALLCKYSGAVPCFRWQYQPTNSGTGSLPSWRNNGQGVVCFSALADLPPSLSKAPLLRLAESKGCSAPVFLFINKKTTK